MAQQASGLRVLVVGAVALVVGLGLGGLAPRAELRSLRDQVEKLEEQGGKCEGRGIGRELASAFQGRPMEAALEEDEVEAIERARDHEAEPEDGVHVKFDVGDGEEVTPEDVEQGLKMAKDAMALRRTQARAALGEQVDPSDAQWDTIDAAVDKMNADLDALARGFVSTLTEGQEPSRRDAMIFAADTLDVLLEADDAIWGSLSEDQRAAAEDEAIDPMAYIDPELLDVFLELDR